MLEVREVSKSFPIGENRFEPVLNNVSFTLPDNGFYFIVGKSGCGKSTLLNILMGLMKPDSGEVYVDGENVTNFTKDRENEYLRDDIGIIFQHYNLFEDLSVKDNLEIAISIKGIIDRSNLDTLLLRYDLYDKLDQKVSTLSGGEKQRLALIRALISSPKILFCDEPTGALDNENGLKLMEDLRKVSRQILVVCVTHNKKLFEKYNDGYVLLKEGCQSSFIKEQKPTNKLNYEKENKRTGNRLFSPLIKKNIVKNIRTNVINSICAAFSIFSMILSLFFNSGINQTKEFLLKTYADNNTYVVSKVKEEEIKDSLISLVKNIKPNYNEIQTLTNEIGDCLIFDDFTYFLSGTRKLVIGENTLTDFTLKPYFNKTHAVEDISVNDSFIELFKKEFNFTPQIGTNFELQLSKEHVYYNENNNENVVENFNVSLDISLREIKDEFGYLTSPTLYYSPLLMEKVLKETEAIKTTAISKEKTSFYDLLEKADNNEAITNYAYNIITLSEESNENLIKLSKDNNFNGFNISNNSQTIVNSFMDLSNSVFLGINIFIFLAIITSLFISAFLSYSSSIRCRKESAILTVLGAKDKDILKIYLKEEMIFTFFGLLFGIFACFVFTPLLNNFLQNFFVVPTVINLNIITILFIFILLITLNFSLNLLTLKFQKRKNVCEELKEE